ncbi:MAG: hypothetical protein R2681_18315 [Pyrinomonadaceae bacterium]
MFETYQKKFGFWYLISVCGYCLLLLCIIEAYEWIIKKALQTWNAKLSPLKFL